MKHKFLTVVVAASLGVLLCSTAFAAESKKKADIDAAYKRIADLEVQVSDLTKQVGSLNTQVSQLTQDKKNLEKQTTDLTSKNQGLQNQVDDLTSKNQDLDKEVSDLTAKNQDLENEVANLGSQNKDIQQSDQQKIAAEESDKAAMKDAYDKLVASLKNEVSQATVDIQNYKSALSINVAEEIFFKSGDAALKKEGQTALQKMGPVLKSFDDKQIRVIGHTDDVPIGEQLKSQYPNNWMLAAARASSVVEYLRSKAGVDPANLTVESHGQYEPIAPNDTPDNRAKNRRIVIIIENKKTYEQLEGE